MRKVYRYVPIEDITDYPTTLEYSYTDYEDINLITICKNNHIMYYLQVLIDEEEEYYDNVKVVEYV